MDSQQLAIATISWARDEAEEQLLHKSLQQLSLLGVPLYITDGGSPPGFVHDITQLEHLHVLQSSEKGLWAQALTSLQQAADSGASFILYTEPDKLDFFTMLPAFINDINVNEHTGVVLASRSAKGMASFPAFQQMTEATINNCCAEVIGKSFDYTYGPFVMNSKLVAHLRDLANDIGWGWRPYAFNIAARMGLKIQSSTGDYYCPEDQREDDAGERVYRMKQLVQNIQGVVLSANATIG
jgi:hypothetical protein